MIALGISAAVVAVAFIAALAWVWTRYIAARDRIDHELDFGRRMEAERTAALGELAAYKATCRELESQLEAVTAQRNAFAQLQETHVRHQVLTAVDPYAAANELLAPLRARRAEASAAAPGGDGDAESAAVHAAVAADGPAARSEP